MGYTIHFLVATSLALLAAETLAYTRLLRSKSVIEAEERGRRVVVLVYALLSVLAASVASVEAFCLALCVLLVYTIVQMLLGLLLDAKSRGAARIVVGGKTYTVHLLGKRVATAFTLVLTGRVYVSDYLLETLTYPEVSAIVAHEVGHLNSFKPAPVAIMVVLYIFLASTCVTGSTLELLEGVFYPSIPVLAATMYTWVILSWTWEHLADIYAYKHTGSNTITVLHKLTLATPVEPSIERLVKSIVKSLKPARLGGLIVNPHPPPELRLWLLYSLAAASTRPGTVPSLGGSVGSFSSSR